MKKIGDITNTADKNGEFTDGNVAAGTPPTQLMGAWFNSVQREILNVLAKAGIPQSATKEDQLAEAISILIGSADYQPSGDYATNSTVNSKFDAANSNANNRVPNTRKVNGKQLNVDISLTAGDVGAYTKAESDTRIADAKAEGTNAQNTANAANTAATNANTNANSRVPNTRKVNNKALSADISLNAGDVGAYTKSETDSKISTASNGAVMNIRRGAAVNPPKQNEYGPAESPAGCVVTSVRHDPETSYGLYFTYRPLQIYVNDSWKTLAGDA